MHWTSARLAPVERRRTMHSTTSAFPAGKAAHGFVCGCEQRRDTIASAATVDTMR
jgi:hypothetical protein